MNRSNLDELRNMAPFYVQGTLSGEEKEAFEKGLSKYPQLQDDVDTYSEIGSFYREIEEEITPPSGQAFTAIMENISLKQFQPAQQDTFVASLRQIKEWFSQIFSVPKLGWGLAVVQCALIIFLLLPNRQDTHYNTLSSSQNVTTGQKTIQLVFDETTTEREIRRIMDTINGEITGGPSTEGMYQISLPQNSNVESTVKNLRKNKKIIFVEKAL